jgi:O-antigen/teichoic acid export membrane protein
LVPSTLAPDTGAAAPESRATIPVSLRKLIRGSGSRVANLALSTVVGFLLTPFIIKSLGAEQYGMWALAYAVIGYYSVLDLGMSAAVFTHISYALGQKDYKDANSTYGTGLAVFGSTGLALALATGVIALILHHTHMAQSATLSLVILIVGLITASSFPMRVPFGTLNAGSHFDITSGLIIFSTLLRAAGTVIVLRLGYGVVGLALVSAAIAVPMNVLAIVAVKRKYPFIHVLRARFQRATAKKLIKFGFPVIFGQLADRVRMQTDSITVSFFLGLAVLAHYNIATTLAMYYMDGIAAIIGVLAPVLAMQKSMKDEHGVRQSILGGTRVGICAGGFAVFGIIAWGHAFILRWMGAPYLDAYPVLVVLALAVFFDVSQSTSVSALYATMNQQYYALVNVIEAVANIVLSIILARPYGMLGIAMGTLIPSVIVRMIIQPILVERRLGLTVRRYWGTIAPTTARMLGCLILPLLITYYLLRATYPSLFAVGALSVAAFALPLWHFEFQMRGARQTFSKMRGWLPWRADPRSA